MEGLTSAATGLILPGVRWPGDVEAPRAVAHLPEQVKRDRLYYAKPVPRQGGGLFVWER